MYDLHFAYPQVFYIFIPVWIIINIYRAKFYKSPVYIYPLTNQIKKTKYTQKKYYRKILFSLKSAFLLGLIFLIARPQWVDSRSKINVDGVDIMITLDVSKSMQFFDSPTHKATGSRLQRIQVAKLEAIRFVKKRPNDPIGIVIFGADAISSCPLTLDKNILQKIIYNIKIGMINGNGTSLGTGIATAINKLKHSKAKSKIMILLTDGRPTPPTEKISVQDAINLAKQFDIKIYTIAIGNKNGGFGESAFGIIQRMPDSVDEKLLKDIADKTNGKFFRARNSGEMKKIYETIDKLETTEYKTDIFSRYYEAFATFVWFVLILFFAHIFLKLFLWRGL